ncbi:MAG: hypothetical protein D6798_08105 [Deltaproteobacteria bacterium]|nr:MAG: hypothetical protein D6798_08105 [Deltaproteobacteria bacterium]
MTEVLFLDALATTATDGETLDGLGRLVARLLALRGLHGVEELVLGRPAGAGPTGPQDPARAMALAAGLPLHTGGFTVDRAGASGLQALACGARAIASGDRDLVVVAATSLRASTTAPPCEAVAWRTSPVPDAEAVALLRQRFDLSPEDEARWAADSAARVEAHRALHEGVGLHLPARTGEDQAAVATTAPPISGAVAFALGSTRAAERLGVEPRARLVAVVDAALDPGWRGMAAGEAARRALERASLRPDEMDRVELDEAHAAWALASAHHAGLPLPRCRPAGGALGLGHLGPAEGLRLLLTLLGGLDEADARYGLCARPGADGQALAVIVDRARFA